MFLSDEINLEQFETIVSNICLLITTGTREVVGSTLSFMKVIISSYSNHLKTQLPMIVCIIMIVMLKTFKIRTKVL